MLHALNNSSPDKMTDNAIMLRVKEGDLDRMKLLFERYHGQLYGFLFRMSNDRNASEDMVQDVFYRLLRSRHTFTGNGEFRTWMYHIARNVLTDHHKKARSHYGTNDMDYLQEKVAGHDTADGKLLQRQEQELLQRALASLPEEFRDVLILSRYQELKYREIADILGISEGAVKVRVYRAMEQLKTIFNQLNIKTA